MNALAIEVRTSLCADPAQGRTPAWPFNRFELAVFAKGHATAVKWETLRGPVHVDEAIERARELAAAAVELGFELRGVRALPKYTADGCYMWSGGPLGPGTIGEGEWRECVAAAEAG